MSALTSSSGVGAGRRMLFRRHFEAYSGGHGKVWDYFNHALALGFDAEIYFAEGSCRDARNPWAAMPERWVDDWRPEHYDVLFLAGLDWAAMPAGLEERVPVVNLIQSVRHSDPALPLRSFLSRVASRICVASEVASALKSTGAVNGPVRVVPAGLRIPAIRAQERSGVLVDGIKRPELAIRLVDLLTADGIAVELLLEHRPRDSYLAALAKAEIAVLLPLEREGFYLPALEAMALGTPVVTLDAIGNREYLRDNENASVSMPAAESLYSAVIALLAEPARRHAMTRNAHETAARFSLSSEREAFAELLGDLFQGGECHALSR